MSVARGRFYTKNEEEMSNSNFIIKVTVANILDNNKSNNYYQLSNNKMKQEMSDLFTVCQSNSAVHQRNSILLKKLYDNVKVKNIFYTCV